MELEYNGVRQPLAYARWEEFGELSYHNCGVPVVRSVSIVARLNGLIGRVCRTSE